MVKLKSVKDFYSLNSPWPASFRVTFATKHLNSDTLLCSSFTDFFETVHKRGEALKRSGSDLEQDLNEFKILRTVRAPMRFGKRSDRLKKAPMRFGKRAPMRFGKRNLESPSYSNEENYDYEDQMDNHFDLYSALRNAY